MLLVFPSKKVNMDYYVFIKEFLSSYSLPTILIAVFSSIAFVLLFNVFKIKAPSSIKAQLPFLFAIALYFVYDMIFLSKAFVFKDHAFILGVFSGSLSVIISTIVKKFIRGEQINLSTKTAILIEGLLEGVIPPTQLTATAIALEQLMSESDLDEKATEIAIAEVITRSAFTNVSQTEIHSVSKLIVNSTKSLEIGA
jgi:hypothetical protein